MSGEVLRRVTMREGGEREICEREIVRPRIEVVVAVVGRCSGVEVEDMAKGARAERYRYKAPRRERVASVRRTGLLVVIYEGLAMTVGWGWFARPRSAGACFTARRARLSIEFVENWIQDR